MDGFCNIKPASEVQHSKIFNQDNLRKNGIDRKKLCPFCNTTVEISLARHIKAEHGEEVLRKAVLTDKRAGTSDVQIGDKYGISFSYLERIITQEYGTNISVVTRQKSKITQWEPKGFRPETTTVWSFKNRGKWATHDRRYNQRVL